MREYERSCPHFESKPKMFDLQLEMQNPNELEQKFGNPKSPDSEEKLNVSNILLHKLFWSSNR